MRLHWQMPASWWYALVTVLGVLLFLPTWTRLASIWLAWEQVMAHGLPTALIYLYLLFRHPPRLPAGEPAGRRFHPVGAALLVILTLAWSIFESVRIDTLSYLCLPTGMVLIAWTLLGARAALAFLPHALLLGLSIPIWSDLIPALVALASVVVGHLVSSVGMTALIEGNHITLPYGRLVIADGCSGIGYLAISLLLGAVLSILNDFRWKGWAVTLTLATAIALVVNWVRIVVLVAVAYTTDMDSPLVRDHELFGWLLYGLAVVPAIYFSPVRKRIHRPGHAAGTVSLTSLIPVLVCLMASQGALHMARSGASDPAPDEALPTGLEAMAAPPPMVPALPPHFTSRYARVSDSAVFAVVSRYRRPSPDAKIVPYLSNDLFDARWYREAEATHGLTTWRSLSTGQRVLVKNLYTVGQYTSDNYRTAKLLQIPAIFQGDTRFRMVTLLAPCDYASCQAAADRLQAAARALGD